MSLQNDMEAFQHIQKLKFTYRYMGWTWDGEKESTASHTWCCLIVSDYLMAQLEIVCPGKYALNKLRVSELITYHDLLEAETGDVSVDPSLVEKHRAKASVEEKAFPVFLQKIPWEIQTLYRSRYLEYEERMTLESKFVKLVDTLEAYFQCFFHKEKFVNWTQEYFVHKVEKHFEPFPELWFIYDELLAYFQENSYFIPSNV